MSEPYYSDATVTLHHGDCLDVLRSLPDASVDAVVTDPPYGLEFMGKEWDGADGFRRSLNLNDAGRDNAFGRTSKTSPEYRTASKAQASRRQEGGISQATAPSFLGGLNPKCLICDRWQRGSNPCRCDAPEWTQERLVRLHSFQEWCEVWSRECLRVLKPGGHMLAFGGTRTSHRLACAVEDAGFEVRDSIAWLYGSGFPKSLNLVDDDGERTGWGTALKPAFEPIVVARKPLAGTVAANVLAHGTGALNIDGCRVDMGGEVVKTSRNTALGVMNDDGWQPTPGAFTSHTAGRWPANVVLDVAQAAALDEQSGELTSGANPTRRGSDKFRDAYGEFAGQEECVAHRGADSGGASRFFFVAEDDYRCHICGEDMDGWHRDARDEHIAEHSPPPILHIPEKMADQPLAPVPFLYTPKADSSERVRVNGTAHPTVKPLALMRWLVRLVTPPGGVVLEPFAGSGTTVEACLLEGFRCIAIEREADYLPLIRQRINRRRDPVAAVKGSGEDGGLFDLLDGESA